MIIEETTSGSVEADDAPTQGENGFVRVAVVEDDPRVLGSLETILRKDRRCRFVAGFMTGEAAIRGIPGLEIEVVVVDINLPGISGVECVRQLAIVAPHVQILMLTVFRDTDTIFEALAAGATGYLVKPVAGDRLVEAIYDVHAGGAPMTGSVARKVVQAFRQGPAAGGGDLPGLSPRERQVLDMLAQGHSYKEIAASLGVRYATVRTHLEHIYKKLHVRSRAEAVARYTRRQKPNR